MESKSINRIKVVNTYIVTYDVSSDSGAQYVYEALYKTLREYGTWARITESCWAICAECTAIEVRDNLRKHMRPYDRLVVVLSGNVGAWSNVRCDSKWLQEHL